MNVNLGLCQCGCGKKTSMAKQTLKASGWVKGEPLRYLPGHYRSPAKAGPGPNPSGLCQCGCGGITPISGSSERGNVKGTPIRYLCGHAQRKPWAIPKNGYVVDPETKCWNWNMRLDKRGYGKTKKDGKYTFSHRAVWEFLVGEIPAGLEMDHLCRNPTCCNPEHLEPVTPIENVRRSRATKLTKLDVSQIKASRATNKELASMFNVSPSNISHIRRGFTWKDVEAAP